MYLPADQRAEGKRSTTPTAAPGDEDFNELFTLHYVFSFIWSLGGNIDDASRPKFDKHFRSICGDIGVEIPEEGTVYDYMVDNKARGFARRRVDEFTTIPSKLLASWCRQWTPPGSSTCARRDWK